MPRPMGTTRRRFLELIVGVAVVHIVAISFYYTLDVPHARVGVQRVFAWTWMAATVGVVLTGLQRLKRARRASRKVSSGP